MIITICNHDAVRILISTSINSMRLDLWSYHYSHIILTNWNHDAVKIPVSSSINTTRLDLWSYHYHYMEP